VNLGVELELSHVPEPLLAAPEGEWHLVWSSEDPRYGGSGDGPRRALPRGNERAPAGWHIPGHGAWVLR
jgi:maltooligosyltrehalose trehalohydrolase